MAQPIVYTDDSDASWTFTVTSKDDTQLDWDPPMVAINDGAYDVTASWDTAAGTVRTLRVPLTGLTAGDTRLYLQVPTGPDVALGVVHVRSRAR